MYVAGSWQQKQMRRLAGGIRDKRLGSRGGECRTSMLSSCLAFLLLLQVITAVCQQSHHSCIEQGAAGLQTNTRSLH